VHFYVDEHGDSPVRTFLRSLDQPTRARFGWSIERLRLRSLSTQAELAERLGVSQAQVARLEKRGYDAYSLNSPPRYVAAPGDGFHLEVSIRPANREAAGAISR
jgi:DNA-binding XRE family transcriptional regulator